MIRLADTATTFEWTTSEQVYPLEKALNGDTLYAKEINFGTLPNNGTKLVAHGITEAKLHSHVGIVTANTGERQMMQGMPGTNIRMRLETSSNVSIITTANVTTWTAIMRIIYSK